MNSIVNFPLKMAPAQVNSVRALQSLFAQACNYLAPLVQGNRCWNRVALHHLAYKGLREQFPQLGSQMTCNAIYSVCRSARIVYQHPQSPWNISRHQSAGLPLLRFLQTSPVYFDRHTLSIKEDRLSLFTLDGRIHFQLDLTQGVADRFRQEKLKEIALMNTADGYALNFHFGDEAPAIQPGAPAWEELPEYLIVEEESAPMPQVNNVGAQARAIV